MTTGIEDYTGIAQLPELCQLSALPLVVQTEASALLSVWTGCAQ